MMKTNKMLHIDSAKKVALVNGLIVILIVGILYFAIPFVLNYPPNSTDNEFQMQIVGIKYTHQFIILAVTLTILIYTALRFVYGRLSLTVDKIKNASEEEINAIRKKAFNYPYLMFVFEIIVPTIVVALLLVAFHTEYELIIRLSTVVLSFSAVFATFSYMISKKFFSNKLVETAEKANNSVKGIRLQLYKRLIVQILPLFLYSFVIILLVSMALMTTEKGDLLNHFYHQELLSTFPDDKVYELKEVKEQLDTIELESEGDHTFIMSAKDGEIYYSPEKLNDFFVNYTLSFYDEMDGYTYEYYGQSREGTVIKINTTDGEYFVGIRYFVFASSFVTPFIIITILLILINTLVILYIGKDLCNDINNVVDGMKKISNSKDVVYANNLPITSNDEIGDLTAEFNEIQKLTKTYVEKLHDSQENLMESERLASLGQLIGGIAHNLKTPIMSISGAAEGLTDLVKEYEASIGDPEVNEQDHHDIAKDMLEWIAKVKTHTEYMSDVITAVKGQAVTLSNEEEIAFTVGELLKRVNILMKHELKNAIIYLNVSMKTDENILIHGDVNSLVQVINNMISNSIQAYNGRTEQNIDLLVERKDNKLLISIRDYGEGMPEKVKNKLFKEMITTKGKNGTGLGLYMSYSTIKAHFNGNISVESKEGEGTIFTITLPIQ